MLIFFLNSHYTKLLESPTTRNALSDTPLAYWPSTGWGGMGREAGGVEIKTISQFPKGSALTKEKLPTTFPDAI